MSNMVKAINYAFIRHNPHLSLNFINYVYIPKKLFRPKTEYLKRFDSFRHCIIILQNKISMIYVQLSKSNLELFKYTLEFFLCIKYM